MLPRQLDGALGVARGTNRKRKVVERRRLGPAVTCGTGDRRSELEVLDGLCRVAAAAGEHSEDVVRLRDGACVVDLSRE